MASKRGAGMYDKSWMGWSREGRTSILDPGTLVQLTHNALQPEVYNYDI